MQLNNFDDNLLLMQEMANIGYWVFYIEKKIVWASDQAFKIYGVDEIDNNFKPEEAIQFSTPLSKRKITNAIDNLIKFNIEYNVDIEINRANDNQLRILNTSGKLIKDEEGNPYKIFGIIQDVTEDRMKSEELKSAKEDLEIALNDSPIPTILHAEDGEILLINKACLDATGFHESQIPDVSTWTKLVHRDRKEFNDEFIKSNFEEGVSSQGGEEYVYTKSGERRIWAFHNSNLGILKDGRKTIITVGVDVTDKKTLIDSLEKSSAYDSLTGVLNRKSYEEALVKLDDKEYYPLVLLFGDINGLKLINDTFGHQAGDKLLSKTAKIIQSKLVDEENIYRIGGDEFAIIMPKSNLV